MKALVIRRVCCVLLFVASVGLGLAARVPAQEVSGRLVGGDSVEVVAGRQYGAGGFHRFFFGGDYRELWTLPLRVAVLDLATEAGGLTPTTKGGGFQTKSLRFRGADGYEYGFRSVDKKPAVLPDELRETIVEDIVEDQTSSQHPAAPAVIARLLDAAGIPHTNPRLVVLPDDPALGEFREEFAGILGFFERRATIERGVDPFAGADEIIETSELFERMRRGPEDRVNLTTFLRARLFDLLVGDWDRHRGQWTWARFGSDSVTYWVPIPEDRDQAFCRYDGVLLSLTRQYAPQIINFGEKLPDITGFGWNGRDVDRQLLVELEWPTWDSVITEFVARVTDSVIDAAARALPAPYFAVDGERMARTLKLRRDRLSEGAQRYYRLLAGEVDVHATDRTETVVVERHEDGSSEVGIYLGTGSSVAERPYWRRRFLRTETEELRFFLYGGDDRFVVRGRHGGIPLRIVGGGSAEVLDSALTGGVTLYTVGNDRASGRVGIDRRPFVLPPKRFPSELPPRDWGHRWWSLMWVGGGPDVGVFLGAGAYVTHYGFRKLPYASRILFRGGFATGPTTGRAQLSAEVYRRNSRVRGVFDLWVSGIDILRYHGLGNETQLTLEDDYYRVNQAQFGFEPAVVLPLGAHGELTLGPSLKFASTKEQDGRILADLTVYGEGGFGQIGWRGGIEFDTRDTRAAATRGVHVQLLGSVYPSIWDVEDTFGEAHAELSTYLTAAAAPLRPTLALRVGGKKVWGRFPFQEAAYIGDASSVRLGRQNRFGGDGAVFGNAELRFRLSRIFLVLPGEMGFFGLGDLGRVFLEGETSDTWHWAAGGGVWLAFLGPANTISLAIAQSEERVGVYATAGFAF
jgi:hypothetical protein